MNKSGKDKKYYMNLLDGARKRIGADLIVVLPIFVDELSGDSGFSQVEILGANPELREMAEEIAELIHRAIQEVADKYPDRFTVRKIDETLN